MRFAEALRAAGHDVIVIARIGEITDSVAIAPGEIGAEWFGSVLEHIERFRADHIVLQYTPLMYSKGDYWQVERELEHCWRSLTQRMPTSLIVHETYFRSWQHPPSLIRGTFQKTLLKRLARVSHHVFTSSQPLVEEMSGWGLTYSPVRMPIGSNIELASVELGALRRELGISDGEAVLTLFGGGTSLKWSARLVDAVETLLNEMMFPHCWLLLGGIPREWFKLKSRVIDPGWLVAGDLSAYVQMSDLFLMPHVAGISAKRGTLITALQHGLPVVGTAGWMTDRFWTAVPGVKLCDARNPDQFAAAVMMFCGDRQMRKHFGYANAEYFLTEFTWSQIVRDFLDVVETKLSSDLFFVESRPTGKNCGT